MSDKLKITKDNNQILEADFICAFEIADFGRKYVIYSFNEVDSNGLAKLNVSQLVDNNLKKIETEDEWSRIKQIMRSVITTGTIEGCTYFNLSNKDIKQSALDESKVIAVKKDAITIMDNHYKKNVLQEVKEEKAPEVIDFSVNSAPAKKLEDEPVNMVVGAEFQAPPAELAPDSTPTMVEPFNLNDSKEVEEESKVEAKVETVQQEIKTEIPNNNGPLTKEEVRKEIEAILNRSDIQYPVIKDQILLAVETAYNNQQFIKFLEEVKLEAVDLAKTTSDLAQANNQMQMTNNVNQEKPTLMYKQSA